MKVTTCYKCTNKYGVMSQKTTIFMYVAGSGYDAVADYCKQGMMQWWIIVNRIIIPRLP